MEPVSTGLSAGQSVFSLAGPVAKWRNRKLADRAADEVEALLDPASSVSRAIIRELRQEFHNDLNLNQGDVVDVLRIVRTPLFDDHLRILTIGSVAGLDEAKSRSRIRDAMAAILRMEGITKPVSESVASLVAKTYGDRAHSAYLALERRDAVRAQTVRLACLGARRSLNITSEASMQKRTEHIGRLESLDLAELVVKIEGYANSVVASAELLSVPTPSREFQVPLDDMFQNSTLTSLDTREDWEDLPEPHNTDFDQDAPELLRLLSEGDNVLLFGNPGSGKSTHSQAAILSLARSVKDGIHDAIPTRVNLRNFARGGAAGDLPALFDFLLESVNSEYSSDWNGNEPRYLVGSSCYILRWSGRNTGRRTAARRSKTNQQLRIGFPVLTNRGYVPTFRV